jgi:hypothetical protein
VPRHSDPLINFSHRLTQIKFIIFEIVLLLVFLFFLFQVASGELGFAVYYNTRVPQIEETRRDVTMEKI